MVTSLSAIFLFAPAWGTTISKVFCFLFCFVLFSSEMGGKTKTKRVLEKENFELGKREWVTRLWTLSEGQGNKKYEFQKQGKEGDGISGFGKWTWDRVLNE